MVTLVGFRPDETALSDVLQSVCEASNIMLQSVGVAYTVSQAEPFDADKEISLFISLGLLLALRDTLYFSC